MTAELKFYVQGNDGNGVRRLEFTKGDIQQIEVSFAPWEDITSVALTGATSEVISGSATVAGEALSASRWVARVGMPEFGRSLIKITGTAQFYQKSIYIDILARNEETPAPGGIWGD